MSVQAQTIYRDAFVEAFEMRQSVLRNTVTTDTETKGGSVVFLVAGTGGRAAVTRGPNGLIPPADDSETQVTVNFAEAHDLQIKTGFDVFRAQSNTLQLMRDGGMAVLNREIDDAIITALSAGSINLGAATTFSKTMVNKGITKLENAFVENSPNQIFGALTPAAWSLATDITSFSNSQYTETNKIDAGLPAGAEMVKWMGVWWMKHPRLPGVGTADATCFLWHRNAVGHAIAAGTIEAVIDRNREQDYSFARHTVYHGAKLLQNSGIVLMHHDDSTLS